MYDVGLSRIALDQNEKKNQVVSVVLDVTLAS